MIATDIKTKIPEGWNQIQFGQLFVERKKSRLKVEEAFLGGQYPFFTSGEKVLSRNDYLSDGSHLFLATGGVANAKFFNGKASYSSDTYCIAGKDENTKLLFYTIWNNLSYINYHFFEGSGLKHLQKSDFKKFKILFPENPKEQQKIAEVLTTVDEAIEKTDAIIEKNKRIKQGLMQDLFRYGIDEHGNIRSEKTHKFKTVKIGNEEMKIPEEWEVKPLLKTVSFIVDNRGKTPPNNNSGDYELIESSSISFVNRFPDYSKVTKFVNEKVFKLWFRDHPVKGDVLISTVGEYSGSSALLSENRGTIAQNVVALRFGLNDARYMFYWTRHSQYWHQIGQVMMNQAQPSLKVPHLLKFSIQLPTIREQTQIADNLFSIDEGIEKEMIYKQKLLSFKRGLMEDLLTGKVRVNSLIN